MSSTEQKGRIVSWVPGQKYQVPKGWTLTPLDETILVFPKNLYYTNEHPGIVFEASDQDGVSFHSDAENIYLRISPGVSLLINASSEVFLVAKDGTPHQIHITTIKEQDTSESLAIQRREYIPRTEPSDDSQVETSEDRQNRIIVIVVFLIGGIGAFLANWLLAQATGFYSRFLAFLGPPLIISAVYFMMYPNDHKKQPHEIPLRMWLMLGIAFLVGLGNMYAISRGLY